jgi:hypothetical protein
MEKTLSPWGQKLYAVVYYSGQSVHVYGDSLEQVTERENALIENWKITQRNPNLGIAGIWEVTE